MFGAALLPGLLSPGVVVVPVNTGVVPTVVLFGVTGTWIVVPPPGAIGPGFTHVTVWPVVVQVFPPLLKPAGAVTPVGRPNVVVIGPVVGPAVIGFVTVTGTLLGAPACNAGDG